MNWYLIQTKPNAHLTASLNLRRQGFEVFIPMIIRTAKKGGKFVDNTSPLFPSYLFMGTELEQISWSRINSTRGISKAVTLDGRYRAVNNQVIEGIKCRCDEIGILQKMEKITSGDRVKIEKGPFANFICTVEEITETQRAWILIDTMHQKTKTNISTEDLLKVS